jgi:hypothetical protein
MSRPPRAIPARTRSFIIWDFAKDISAAITQIMRPVRGPAEIAAINKEDADSESRVFFSSLFLFLFLFNSLLLKPFSFS